MNTIPQNSYHCHTNSCACKKHTYSSEDAAVTVRRHRLQSRNNPPEYLRVYYCPTCNGWHLTSQRKNQHLHESTRNVRKIRHQWKQQLQELLYTENSTAKTAKDPGYLVFAEDNRQQVSLKSAISNQYDIL